VHLGHPDAPRDLALRKFAPEAQQQHLALARLQFAKRVPESRGGLDPLICRVRFTDWSRQNRTCQELLLGADDPAGAFLDRTRYITRRAVSRK